MTSPAVAGARLPLTKPSPITVLALALGTVLLAAQVALRSDQQKEPSLTIDGSKNPEKFPQWYIWEQTFQILRNISGQTPAQIRERLGLSDAEQKILFAEVKAFDQQADSYRKQLLPILEAAKAQGKNPNDIHETIHAIDLKYRHKILEGRQRIYDQIPPERRVLLQSFIDNLVKGTTVYLSGRSVKYFFEPG